MYVKGGCLVAKERARDKPKEHLRLKVLEMMSRFLNCIAVE